MNEQSKKFREYLQIKEKLKNSEKIEEMVDKIYDEVLEEENKTKENKERE